MDKTRIRHAAKFSKAAYIIGQDGKTKDSIDEVNALVADTGFRIDPALSDENISTFRNSTTGAYHIAHKGTQVGASTGLSDLIADAAFAYGRNTAHVTSRTAATERIIDQIDPDARISMSGHSLGGHTASYAMANSQKVQQRVAELDTFDAANNFIHPVDLRVPKETRAALDGKVTHHRMNADLVSLGEQFPHAVPFGKAVTYKLNSKNMGTIERALYAHEIDHFIDKDLRVKGEKREPDDAPAPIRAESAPPPTQDAMSAGSGSAPYVNAPSLCRQYPYLPECAGLIK